MVLGTAVIVVSTFLEVPPQLGAAAGFTASTSATLLVNDTNAIGTVGAIKLSLDEAIGLADGSLALTLKLLTLAKLPVLKPVRTKVLELLREAELLPES